MRIALLPLALFLIAAAPPLPGSDQARRVTIERDDFGIAHVHGRTDADAVFGMIYAQAEDDFPRIEANYLTALGRTAEAEGEAAIWRDLRARLYVSENELKANYVRSPTWLRDLMDAWAAGLNHYLATHPHVRPRVLTRFEPWMALSFTEGSIGGDIERIDLAALAKFYGATKFAAAPFDPEPRGSNGIAIAPAITRDGKALLLINPHTSFFFRSELQMTSDQGLDAYGAATWGQFFVYQGFNRTAGWMHTSAGNDSVDEFSIDVRRGVRPSYRYGTTWRQLGVRPITIRYRTRDGKFASRSFRTWRDHRGPIVRSEGNRWVSFAMMDRPVEALQQSFLRTKARDLASFIDVAKLRANSSNGTLFADAKGRIAYLHPQLVPRRNVRFDYRGVIDGSDPSTDWGGLHAVADMPNSIAPPNGWVQNTNTWPYRAAGAYSPKLANFPKYMDMFGENYRGLHALRLLEGSKGWTLDRLQAAAFDSYQPGFADILPPLVSAWKALPAGDPRRAHLAAPIAMLERWDYRWSAESEAQSLATFWAEEAVKKMPAKRQAVARTLSELSAGTSADAKLAALDEVMVRLTREYGQWRVAWGQINRFQRISPAIDHPFSDTAPSIAVPFASGNFGSLASFGAAPRKGTTKWYGTSGNSFVAVVEFGPRVRARAVSAGGESGDPASPHFNDQAARYAAGALRSVNFHPDERAGHIKRRYSPGE
ncbi:penicillin acylase family protein [Sphingomonas sp. LY160]|uniref:penicillin acylase family protein n=1 Tax=Sphingomonas sp. LY160 TaxID=3095342 RepID=UPI002ADEE16C|nr:penicillin acylase family protein [Sphingomonas sp. LY160]MEA1071979.1 penicillin acylase family protein [Sphingomonas sp. LY160]